MIIVSVQRLDVVSIDYINMNEGITIQNERDNIIAKRGVPIKIKELTSGACKLDYIGEFGYESVMICKGG